MKDCADNKKSAVLKQRIAILAIQLHIQKILVYSCIAVKLRVESGDKLFSLSCGNYLSADLGENFRIIEHLIDIRCADKCHRNYAYAVELCVGMEASELSAVSVAVSDDRHCL